jgi:hypothetical protein
MRKVSDAYLRKAAVVLAMAAVCVTVGCSSEPEPPPPPPEPEELSAMGANALISQKWSHNELNHFTVTFHSDTVIACGVQNDLWKHVETPHLGLMISTYELTKAGGQALFAIDLKESGRSHEIILQGPYLLEVNGITPGSQPDMRQAAIRWEIDWNKAPAALKACLPRFELSGSQVALFKVIGGEWSFVSFLKPTDVTAPTQATPGAAFPMLPRP